MKKDRYSITNPSDGAFCLTGRTQINIPANCENYIIELSDEQAKAIIGRIKLRYPVLKIKKLENRAETVPAKKSAKKSAQAANTQADNKESGADNQS